MAPADLYDTIKQSGHEHTNYRSASIINARMIHLNGKFAPRRPLSPFNRWAKLIAKRIADWFTRAYTGFELRVRGYISRLLHAITRVKPRTSINPNFRFQFFLLPPPKKKNPPNKLRYIHNNTDPPLLSKYRTEGVYHFSNARCHGFHTL